MVRYMQHRLALYGLIVSISFLRRMAGQMSMRWNEVSILDLIQPTEREKRTAKWSPIKCFTYKFWFFSFSTCIFCVYNAE